MLRTAKRALEKTGTGAAIKKIERKG